MCRPISRRESTEGSQQPAPATFLEPRDGSVCVSFFLTGSLFFLILVEGHTDLDPSSSWS